MALGQGLGSNTCRAWGQTHAGWVAHLQVDFFGLSIKISLHQVFEKL